MKTQPAFPTAELDGMTLRDWFAGQALIGLYANPGTLDMCMEEIAATAYTMADTMIDKRQDE
jgi:hypothetical protein